MRRTANLHEQGFGSLRFLSSNRKPTHPIQQLQILRDVRVPPYIPANLAEPCLFLEPERDATGGICINEQTAVKWLG